MVHYPQEVQTWRDLKHDMPPWEGTSARERNVALSDINRERSRQHDVGGGQVERVERVGIN